MSNVNLGKEIEGIYISTKIPHVIDIISYLEDTAGIELEESFVDDSYPRDFIFLIKKENGFIACYGCSPQFTDREVQSLQDFITFYEMPKTKLGNLL